MAVKFKDYYELLGVARDATQEQIQRAFRDHARKHHPDVSKQAGAEARFKEFNEAYEVLKDPSKRKRYDALGERWKTGQEFTPPPGWEHASGGDGMQFEFHGDAGGDFSEFFQSLFGGGPFVDVLSRGGKSRRTQRAWRMPEAESLGEPEAAADVELRLDVTPWEAALGAEVGLGGFDRPVVVKVPAGTSSGQKLRLRGIGLGRRDGTRGDAIVVVRIVLPKQLTKKERELFEQLQRESKFRPEGRG